LPIIEIGFFVFILACKAGFNILVYSNKYIYEQYKFDNNAGNVCFLFFDFFEISNKIVDWFVKK